MASVNQTRPHCVNQMGKTHSKPLAARHGRGTAWARHAMCESALKHAVVVALLEILMIAGNSGLYFTVTSLVLFLVGIASSPIVKTHHLMASPVQMY
jgi:hypothetical protein